MSKFKKVLALLLVVALTAALSVSLTMAYLQDDDSDVNVMTLGNVYIEQIEQERVDTEELPTAEDNLKAFTQAKPLYPAVYEGSSIPWDTNSVDNQAWKVVETNDNVLDKFVTVKNTGASAAYVRTIIAYEGNTTYGPEGDYIHVVHNGSNVNPAIEIKLIGEATIYGKIYTVYSYTYPTALAAGETTIPSLKQVYMDKTVGNDVVAYYGKTYDILALSQAIQVKGFEEAGAEVALNAGFGEVTAANIQKWFKGTEVSTADELKNALKNGESVVLTNNIDMSGDRVEIAANDNVVIDLNGYTLTSKDGGGSNTMAIYVNKGATLTLEDSVGSGKIVASCYGVYVQPNATFIMDGGEISVSGNGKYDMGVIVWNGKFIMNGGTINAQYGVWTSNYWLSQKEVCGLCEVTIDDSCILNSTSGVDIDVGDAPDTILNIPSTLKVNYTAQ